MICKICGRTMPSFLALGIHLSKSHKDCCGEAYYDKYMKTENEGVCICGNKCKFISLRLGYHTYCSHQCQAKNTVDKVKTTKVLRYGEGNYFSDDGKKRIAEANKNNKETRIKKLKETNLQKYGSEWPSQNEIVKEKVANTNISKYGNKCSLHGNNQSKTQEIFKEKYGFDSPVKNDTVKNKIKNTNLMRYGATSPLGAKQCIEKGRQTYFNRTGYCSPAQNPENHKFHKKRYAYDGLFFDSSWELAYFIFHKEHGFNIDAHPSIAYEYEYENKKHSYLPDFLVDNAPIEIKGAHFFENGKMINPWDRSKDDLFEAKHQCMIAHNVKIVTDCSLYLKYLEDTYGKDCLDKFDSKTSNINNS